MLVGRCLAVLCVTEDRVLWPALTFGPPPPSPRVFRLFFPVRFTRFWSCAGRDCGTPVQAGGGEHPCILRNRHRTGESRRCTEPNHPPTNPPTHPPMYLPTCRPHARTHPPTHPPTQEMFAWAAKTRRAPFGHGGDTRVYGVTTTTMHDSGYTPPPLYGTASPF